MSRSDRIVATWLLACCLMVAGMVALGGLTRLTGSGLSMVEWQPHVLLPPLTEAAWQAEFAKYQASPQYSQVNAGMDLAGFQSIFWLEYVHRLWGRLVGLAFAVPLAVFAAKGWLSRKLLARLALILAVGAMQGVVGWLMVASGLVDRPEVSHYRLAAHLLLAFALAAALLWTALGLLHGPARPERPWVLALVAATVCWGALVAGLKAGLIYDSFPLMGGRLFPAEGLDMAPVWANFVENHAAVQFTHRLLAMATVAVLLAQWNRGGRWRLAAAWSLVQAGLGVATLLNHVPVALASAHQMGALVLLCLVVWAVRGRGGVIPTKRSARRDLSADGRCRRGLKDPSAPLGMTIGRDVR